MSTNEYWNFFSGSQLSFGRGAASQLTSILRRRHAQRVLVITDPTLEQLGLLERVLEPIRQAECNVEVFAGGVVEPSTAMVAQVAEQGSKADVDTVVGLGGGSNMDLAKLVSAVLAHQTSAESFIGFDEIPGPTAPLICLPTTAGTGSEVSHAAIIKDEKTGKKEAALSQYLRPVAAIVDPSLTDSCPERVSAESGIDALTHAMEGFLSTSYQQFPEDLERGLPYEGNHPLGDLYAEKAIELMGKHLRTAVGAPEEQIARDGMALAATLAGVAFSACGVTLAHALEYWIGGQYACSHGVGNGIVLPEVMRFYIPQRATKLARASQLLEGNETTRPVEVGSAQEAELAERAVEQVIELRRDIGLPEKLSEVGANQKDLTKLAKKAFLLKRLMQLSPRTVELTDLQQILEACL